MIAIGLGFIFLLLLKLCGRYIVWLMICSLLFTLLLLGTLTLVNIYHTGPLNESINAMRVKYLSFMMHNKTLLVTVAILMIIGAIVFFIITVCLRNSIKKGASLV